MGAQVAEKTSTASTETTTASGMLIRIVLLCCIDAFAIYFIVRLVSFSSITLAVVIAGITILINAIFLLRPLYPLRWMAIGLVFLILFSIYPNIFTAFIAFTNYGDGHLLVKQQAIEQIQKEKYIPEGGSTYQWTAFNNGEDYALWLQAEDGTAFLAYPDQPLIPAAEADVGELDANGIPAAVGDLKRLNAIQTATDETVSSIVFGDAETGVQIKSGREAAQLKPRYTYDEANDVLIDGETGTEFRPIDGTFSAENGDELRPGFRSNVGLENFSRFYNSPALSGPLVRIITWNFAFAFLSVFMTFALGLGIAYLYNDPEFPGRKILRSFLLIPYTIPALITILIWKGLLNEDFGVVNNFLSNFIGTQNLPAWTTNQWWAKAAILIVNLWLGYPYFMLICSGALQAIPKDLYAAADVDGANGWQKFSKITLPLLFVSVGPLLIASFTYNFNNFNLIYLFIGGGPPIAGASTRAGHTDILISYVYNLAFAGGRGFDYGLASAITIVIFVIVGTLTLLQFRFTNMWEEVGENV